ncbi:MAG: hypothetical protein CMO34_00030 [Verrucomicrobia bacterium]|nr:hypothetical protein [Verrucomicrobiota bacterium]
MRILTFIVFIFLLLSLKSQDLEKQRVWLDGELYIELFDSTERHPNRYTANNHIYKAGTSIKFDYTYIDSKGKAFKFERSDDNSKPWKLHEMGTSSASTVRHIRMDVHYAQDPIQSKNPSYNKTTTSYAYETSMPKNQISYRGLIENDLNVWLQPPADGYFNTLQLNPFPLIQAPYKKGNRWKWSNSVNTLTGLQIQEKWEGNLEISHEYSITDERYLQTKIGRLPCYIVEANGKSKLGSTKLKSYFNLDYGFVKLEYLNIDGSRFIFELIEFIPPQ